MLMPAKQKTIRFFQVFFSSFLFLFVFSSSVQAAALQVDPAGGSYSLGDSFDVAVKLTLTSGESVDGVDALLTFDPSMMEIKSIAQGSLFPTFASKSYDNSGGSITLGALAQTDSPVTTSGTVAIVSFTTKKAGTSSLSFNFTSGSGVDSNVAEHTTGSDILESVVNGSYTIDSDGSTGSTTTTTSNSDSSSNSGVGGTTTQAPPSLPVAGNEGVTLLLTFLGLTFAVGGLAFRRYFN